MGKNLTWHSSKVSSSSRVLINGHKGAVVWFTGLSGSGKSTLAYELEKYLFEKQCQTFVLDGDNVRQGLCSDIGFSDDDRHENIRRVGEVGKLFSEAGVIVIAAFISPFNDDRQNVRKMFNQGQFIEVFCDASLSACERRDVKGYYSRARTGNISKFTGVSSGYEIPVNPELTLNTEQLSISVCVDKIYTKMVEKEIFGPG